MTKKKAVLKVQQYNQILERRGVKGAESKAHQSIRLQR